VDNGETEPWNPYTSLETYFAASDGNDFKLVLIANWAPLLRLR